MIIFFSTLIIEVVFEKIFCKHLFSFTIWFHSLSSVVVVAVLALVVVIIIIILYEYGTFWYTYLYVAHIYIQLLQLLSQILDIVRSRLLSLRHIVRMRMIIIHLQPHHLADKGGHSGSRAGLVRYVFKYKQQKIIQIVNAIII